MLIANLRVTVKKITEDSVELSTEQGQIITVPKDLIPGANEGQVIYLAADEQPLVSAETRAKDVLNEVIKEDQ